jgi:hypothetical protein
MLRRVFGTGRRFWGLWPLGFSMLLMASLALFFVIFLDRSVPPAKAVFACLLFLFVCSHLFVPSFFSQIIEPMRSAKLASIYWFFSWAWPPLASLGLVSRQSAFFGSPIVSLGFGIFWSVCVSLFGFVLLRHRTL